MTIYYEDIVSKVRNVTEEENNAVKVIEYRKLPEPNRNIKDYVELAARAYAKMALYALFLELKHYAFEMNSKHFVVEIRVCGEDHIKAFGSIKSTDIDCTIPLAVDSRVALNTPTIQECIFRGIYGEAAKDAYIQKVSEVLQGFGELHMEGDILSVYTRIVFCH